MRAAHTASAPVAAGAAGGTAGSNSVRARSAVCMPRPYGRARPAAPVSGRLFRES
jgi:hypothetical protein